MSPQNLEPSGVVVGPCSGAVVSHAVVLWCPMQWCCGVPLLLKCTSVVVLWCPVCASFLATRTPLVCVYQGYRPKARTCGTGRLFEHSH